MCEVLQLFEVITGEGDLIRCVSQPPHVVLDLLDEFVCLLIRIGVVIAKIACSSVSYGRLEVYTDRFDVSDVEIPVGLWREAKTRPILGYPQVLLINFFGIALLFDASGLNLQQFIPQLVLFPGWLLFGWC
jgi:hypothetical protein